MPARNDTSALIERLNEFQRSVVALAPPRATTPAKRRKQAAPPAREADILRRLERLDSGLALSLRQVLSDLDDPSRATYMGAVGEAREVLRATAHRLAPDEKVKAQAWFKGDKGRPTQAERARHAAEQRTGKDADEAAAAVDTFEAKLGTLFRTVYSSASGKFHTSTQRAEAKRIVGYVLLVLDDILPD